MHASNHLCSLGISLLIQPKDNVELNLCNIAQFGKNYVLAAACLKTRRVQGNAQRMKNWCPGKQLL